MTPSRIPSRSAAETHAFMDLMACACGEVRFESSHQLRFEGRTTIKQYRGACAKCGTLRAFEFAEPAWPADDGDRVQFGGGGEPSRVLDPGQFLFLSDRAAKAVPAGALDARAHASLAYAIGALEEVLKFFAPEAGPGAALDASLFVSPLGQHLHATQPFGTFTKARLEARLTAYERRLVPATRACFPVLKEAGWAHAELCVTRPLPGVDAPDAPLVVLAEHRSEGYAFLTKEEVRSLDHDALYAAALARLCAQPVEWQRVVPPFLTAARGDFSAEKLLDNDFLADAARRLKTTRLLVAAPRRSILHAADADGSARDIATFSRLAQNGFDGDRRGDAPISSRVFVWSAGSLAGTLPGVPPPEPGLVASLAEVFVRLWRGG